VITGPHVIWSLNRSGKYPLQLQNIEPKSLLSKLNYEDAKKKRIYLDHTLNDLGNWTHLPELSSNCESST
jgi:hypothetical protein